jgi:hypothetical protein
MTEKEEQIELLNRLHYVIEEHPLLSGLMTNEHQRYLKYLAQWLDLDWTPTEPDYEIDL